jgi:diguanylate cyclase (GGDEF)-like protein
VHDVRVTWLWSPGGVITLLASALMLLLAVLAWRRRGTAEATWLALVLFAAAAWGVAYTLELSATSLSARETWGDVKYVGICALPPAWVGFVTAYTGRGSWLRHRWMLLLVVEPVVVLGLLANERTHDLIRYYPAGSASRVASGGELFWLHVAYTYLLLWGATAVLVSRLARISPLYRRQSVALVLSITPPFAVNILYNLGVQPFDEIDLTPFAFLGSGFVLVWGVLRFRLVRLQPVGRSHVFMTIRDPVLTLDRGCCVIDANPAAAEALGVPAEDLVGRRVDSLLTRSDDLLAGADGPVEELIGERWFELQCSQLTGRRGRRRGVVVMAHDVTEQKSVQEKLSHDALHDPLTGTANRTLYFDRLAHALDHASRTRHPVTVMYVDLDSFKAINDEHGHAVGDAVLMEVARRLRECMRKDDTVARLGGDEFAVLLEDAAGEQTADEVAAHVRSNLALPIVVNGCSLRVSASIGSATGLDDRPDQLLHRADESMYAAKRNGTRTATRRVPRPRRTPEQR